MPVKTLEEAKSFVKKWLDDYGLFKADGSEQSKEKVHFLYAGVSETGTKFNVQQPNNMPRLVGITSRIVFDSRQLKLLSDFNQQQRIKFLENLGNGLLFVGPKFSLGPDIETIKWLIFIKEISYDELTEGRLIDALDQISRAVILGSKLIVSELGDAEEEKT